MTERENELLGILRSAIAAQGFPPSYAEIAKRMGYASKSRVYHMVLSLEELGKIRRHPYKTRSIEIIHETCPHCGRDIA